MMQRAFKAGMSRLSRRKLSRKGKFIAVAFTLIVLSFLFFLRKIQIFTGGFIFSSVPTFQLPPRHFHKHNIPIIIFSSYRYEYLFKSMNALAKMSKDIEPRTKCIFILHRTIGIPSRAVIETKLVIARVTFCTVRQWEYQDQRPVSSLAYKILWFKVMRRFFSESIQTGRAYNGDVLILEEDAVLSPDAMKVLWFCRRIKNELGVEAWQVVLGSHAGESLVNPHPDTFVVRRTIYLQPMAYAFNRTLWNLLSSFEDVILNHEQDDFTDAASILLGKYFQDLGQSYHIASPTLSRAWHIGGKGIGLYNNNSGQRILLPQPPWRRQIDLDKAMVNPGIRDNFGAYCVPENLQTTPHGYFEKNSCNESLDRYIQDWRYHVVNCVKFESVEDQCMRIDPLQNKVDPPE